ncbi:2-dehydropantoate 2-reductase [Aquincola sp. S2]|uniref:2-dehydropantoate 2-reductase n=2 Tax=Pseudaquabacterium terrae TaxID=2732868 RepID=A0ABX2EQ70_9BURK|nr:2-dehydropantoate 2-reductase [Aquabacterium terrae]NRF70845.1 2-dehydropantoate 2-reductase [Aquabacterium terrae]
MGAGSVGCWLGGRLQAAGVEVHFVGRARMLDALRRRGLRLTDIDGGDLALPPASLALHGEVPAGLAPALVLLCVKSGATADAARELGARLPPGTPLLSMQNGIANAALAQQAAPALRCLPGMVPYNVAELAPGHLHRGTDGALAAQRDPALEAWKRVFDAAGLPIELHADLRSVQWGKLLLNLNNAVNALSGLPLRAQLLDRDLRRCTAALIEETLTVLAAAGIAPAQLSPLPPRWIPRVLRLPTPLFRIVAARMLRIDDKARSSMADDLTLGRITEVDALQGEVVRLAQRHGVGAPLNQRIASLVQAWPSRRQAFAGAELRRALEDA